MTHIGIEIAAAIATVSAAVLALAYHLHLSREARLRRKEASRFPMFAVRDQLVELVADRKIDANEAAWTMTYATVNSLLNLHQKLHLDEVIKQYIIFSVGERAVPVLRLRAQKIRGEMARAQKRYPAFGKVLRDMEQAFHQMVLMRTGLWHTICLRFFLWRLTLPPPLRPRFVFKFASVSPVKLVETRGKANTDRVRNVRKSLNRPRSGDLAAFASYRSAAC